MACPVCARLSTDGREWAPPGPVESAPSQHKACCDRAELRARPLRTMMVQLQPTSSYYSIQYRGDWVHPHPWMPVVGYIAGTTVAGDEMTSSEMSIPFGRHASSSSLCPTNVMYSCASSHLIPPRAGTVVLKEDGHSKGKGKIERRQMARCALAPHSVCGAGWTLHYPAWAELIS